MVIQINLFIVTAIDTRDGSIEDSWLYQERPLRYEVREDHGLDDHHEIEIVRVDQLHHAKHPVK
jgi:hypothetical protein